MFDPAQDWVTRQLSLQCGARSPWLVFSFFLLTRSTGFFLGGQTASHQVMSVMMIYEACLSKHLNTEEVSSDDVEKKFLFSIDIL